MKYKIPVLKKTAEAIAEAYGVTYFEASKIVGFYSSVDDPETDKLIAGDFSPVEKAAAAKGVKLNKRPGEKGIPDAKTEKPEKKPVKDKGEEKPARGAILDGVKVSKKTAAGVAAGGGPMPIKELHGAVDDLGKSELPANMETIIDDAIKAFCEKWKIDDVTKISQERWRGFCMVFGFEVKRNRLLHDVERERREGGDVYDPERVEALLNTWASYCQLFDKIPLAADFVSFAGLSMTYFTDSNTDHGLTSARVEMWQKLQDLQEVGLSGRLIDGKRNPTGTIFFLKNWHGWKDQREIVHSDAVKGVQLDVLPTFSGENKPLLEEKPGNSGFLSSEN